MSHLLLFAQPGFVAHGRPLVYQLSAYAWQLLALVALNPTVPLEREFVAFTLWPDERECAALGRLRRTLHDLRRQLPLGDALLCERGLIGWNASGGVAVDVMEFDACCAEPERLATAAGIYRGDLLESCDAEWLEGHRIALRERFFAVAERLIESARLRGDLRALSGFARRLLAADPWREDVVRLLIESRAAAGDRAGALFEYADFSRRLQAELSVEPMAETMALARAIAVGGGLVARTPLRVAG